MPHVHPRRHPIRVTPSFLIALLMIALPALMGATIAVAQPAGADVSDTHLTSGDIGVSPGFVAADTVVRTPSGDLAGPDGVQAFVDELRRDYPDAAFSITEVRAIGKLIVVEWQGTTDGLVAVPGRTLITVEDGRVAIVAFLNLNGVAPLGPWGQYV